jgi:hypothetical protein
MPGRAGYRLPRAGYDRTFGEIMQPALFTPARQRWRTLGRRVVIVLTAMSPQSIFKHNMIKYRP